MEIDPVTNVNTDAMMTETTAKIIPPPSVVPPSRLKKMEESLKLEHQLLRVPFEHYRKTIRDNHPCIDKEVSAVVSGVEYLADSDLSKDETVSHLTRLVSRLQGLKRKLEEGNSVENLQAQRCRARMDHLESADVENMTDWNNTKLHRILVDYMLRMSYVETATKFSESSNLLDLVDIDIFPEPKKMTDALKNRDVASALAWCADNKLLLKKSKSKLEFRLRLQEFIEMVRSDSYKQAIHHAQKHLAPWGATDMKELQSVVAILAFKSTTECTKYKVLFEQRRWDVLVQQFKQEFCMLHGMTAEPLLYIYLQTGLSVLKVKTPYGFKEGFPDPLSHENFQKLASPLPYTLPPRSKLLCYISNEWMDAENQPQVLPNGYVYSTKALKEMADKNGGKITCPRTGFVCNNTDLLKAYVS